MGQGWEFRCCMLNKRKKYQAIACFKSYENVSIEDVVDIIESIQRCYDGDDEKEIFLIKELQSFIKGIKE